MAQEKNTTNVIFSGKLAEAMKNRGITQMDLANTVGCSQGAVSLYLKGRVPNGEILVAVARALGTTAEALCGFEALPANNEAGRWRSRAEAAEGKISVLRNGLSGLLKKI